MDNGGAKVNTACFSSSRIRPPSCSFLHRLSVLQWLHCFEAEAFSTPLFISGANISLFRMYDCMCIYNQPPPLHSHTHTHIHARSVGGQVYIRQVYSHYWPPWSFKSSWTDLNIHEAAGCWYHWPDTPHPSPPPPLHHIITTLTLGTDRQVVGMRLSPASKCVSFSDGWGGETMRREVSEQEPPRLSHENNRRDYGYVCSGFLISGLQNKPQFENWIGSDV